MAAEKVPTLFLAKAQGTRYAVLPIHTQTESDLFFKEVGPGGTWFEKGKQPDFTRMAYWWSEKANGKDIFYKLPEHLALHYSVYKNRLAQTETMVASQTQRQPNQKRIKSKAYVAKVLPPSLHSQLGVAASLEVPDIQMGETDRVEPMVLVDDVSMEDLQATLGNVSTELPVQTGMSVVHSTGLQTHAGTRVWVRQVWVRVKFEVPAQNPHPRGGFGGFLVQLVLGKVSSNSAQTLMIDWYRHNQQYRRLAPTPAHHCLNLECTLVPPTTPGISVGCAPSKCFFPFFSC